MKRVRIWIVFGLMILLQLSTFSQDTKKTITIKSAELKDAKTLLVNFSGLPSNIKNIQFNISPKISTNKPVRKGPFLEIVARVNFDIKKDYVFSFKDKSSGQTGEIFIDKSILMQDELNKIYSDKPLGYFFENGKSIFRYFVPRGKSVFLVIFDKYDDANGKEYEMINDGKQVFEYTIDGELWGK